MAIFDLPFCPRDGQYWKLSHDLCFYPTSQGANMGVLPTTSYILSIHLRTREMTIEWVNGANWSSVTKTWSRILFIFSFDPNLMVQWGHDEAFSFWVLIIDNLWSTISKMFVFFSSIMYVTYVNGHGFFLVRTGKIITTYPCCGIPSSWESSPPLKQ